LAHSINFYAYNLYLTFIIKSVQQLTWWWYLFTYARGCQSWPGV